MELDNKELLRKENNLKKGLVILGGTLIFLILGYFAGQALFHFSQ